MIKPPEAILGAKHLAASQDPQQMRAILLANDIGDILMDTATDLALGQRWLLNIGMLRS